MAIFGLLFLIVALVLIGVGIVAGLILSAITAAFVFAGILSTSAAIGVWFKRPGPAIRAFTYQLALATAIPCGISLIWAISALFSLGLSLTGILLIGAFAGAAAGLALAAITLWSMDRIQHFLSRRQGKPRPGR